MPFDDAPVTVIETRVELGEGALANEPITVARVRDARGRVRELRVVGGHTPRGFTRLAGHVVPFPGATVRADLIDLPARDGTPPPALSLASWPGARTWSPSTPAGTWPAASLPVPFVLASPGSAALGARAAPEIEIAMRTWSELTCTAFRATFAGARAAAAGDDGVNAIIFHETSWPAELDRGALAQTVLHVDGAGKLRDADIHVNAFDYRYGTDAAPGTIDARSVLVHELGHALGLGHSAEARATMAASGAGMTWRTLEADDVLGACALYPGQGAAACPASPCPADYVCVGGACQRPGEVRSTCSPCARVPGACDGAGEGARCIDLPGAGGATAGRVCAAACAPSEPKCPVGFSCVPTTEAGDLQCAPNDGCRGGASPCRGDPDCRALGHRAATCVGGACVEPAPAADAGDAGAPDAGQSPVATPIEPGGCSVASPARTGAPTTPWAALALVFALSAARARYPRPE